jgi:hypothetical protein
MHRYYAGTRGHGRHAEREHPGGIEFITVVEIPGEIERIGIAASVGRADDGQSLYAIYMRGHAGALPGQWTLVDDEFRPAR